MKVRTAALAATAAASSMAQSVSYTTITYEDCPTSSLASLITVTSGVTVTYCPECEGGMTSTGPPPPPGPGYTTVYTTVYESLCPTGIVPATYTVTESCTDATPTWTPGPDHIPNGFTTTVKQCTVCAPTPTAVTITEPCGCESTGGVPMPPGGGPPAPPANSPAMPPPAVATSPASPPASTPCNGANCGGSGNQSPPPPPGSPPASPPSLVAPPYPCNGTMCGGNGTPGSAPPPPPAAPAAPCNGTMCGGSANQGGMTTSPAAGTPMPSGPVTPNTGAASSVSAVGITVSAVLAVLVGALALAL